MNNQKSNQLNSAEPDVEQNLDQIKEFGSSAIKTKRGVIHCLTIIGQIEGHSLLSSQTKSTKYEHLLPQLVAIDESEEVDGMLVILNTVGGDVEAGLAISEMISTMKKPVVSIVLGGGHSIGVPLAVSAKYSFIARSATMTIHPLRLNGQVIAVSQTYEYFSKIQDRIVDFVVRNSKISKETFNQYLLNTKDIANDVGTILFGEDAVKCGLIDEVGGLKDATEKLYSLIDETRQNNKKEHSNAD